MMLISPHISLTRSDMNKHKLPRIRNELPLMRDEFIRGNSSPDFPPLAESSRMRTKVLCGIPALSADRPPSVSAGGTLNKKLRSGTRQFVCKKTFTLIELLIAVTIITLIILSVYSAFNTGILAYKKMDSAFDSYQEARIILNSLETDLKNSFAYSEESSFFNGSPQALDFFNISQIYDKDKQYSDLCRIKYHLEGDLLKRTIYNGIAALTENENVEAQDFSNRVKSIDFEYAALSEGEKKTIVWQNIWPQKDEQAHGLPLAVKVKLLVIDAGKTQRLLEFTKTIALAQGNVSVPEEK